jgi:hypothetical protein
VDFRNFAKTAETSLIDGEELEKNAKGREESTKIAGFTAFVKKKW